MPLGDVIGRMHGHSQVQWNRLGSNRNSLEPPLSRFMGNDSAPEPASLIPKGTGHLPLPFDELLKTNGAAADDPAPPPSQDLKDVFNSDLGISVRVACFH